MAIPLETMYTFLDMCTKELQILVYTEASLGNKNRRLFGSGHFKLGGVQGRRGEGRGARGDGIGEK